MRRVSGRWVPVEPHESWGAKRGSVGVLLRFKRSGGDCSAEEIKVLKLAAYCMQDEIARRAQELESDGIGEEI